MAELIAAQTAQADSADVVITSGGSATFLLKGGTTDAIPASSVALIQAKNAAGTQYVTIGQLDAGNPIKVLSAAGTFRVRKQRQQTPSLPAICVSPSQASPAPTCSQQR